jgi:hypothetical protein
MHLIFLILKKVDNNFIKFINKMLIWSLIMEKLAQYCQAEIKELQNYKWNNWERIIVWKLSINQKKK